MQVSATLIAAQQAAREAQQRFQAAHVAKPQASFAANLGEPDAFAPLPLKQTAKPLQPQPAATPAPAGRMGTLLDIKV